MSVATRLKNIGRPATTRNVKMQQRSLLAFAVPKAQAERSRQQRLDAEVAADQQRQQLATELGLPWPQQRRVARPGRPSRQYLWEQALYRAIQEDRLPENTPREVPVWYRKGPIISQEEALEGRVEEAKPLLDSSDPVVAGQETSCDEETQPYTGGDEETQLYAGADEEPPKNGGSQSST